MDGRDIRLVKGLLGKILNLGQISLSLIFSLAMTVILAISMKGSEAAAPLMIFSGLISVLFLTLLVYAAAIRPQLIQGLQSLEGQRGWVTFRNRDILVKVGNCPEVTVGYKAGKTTSCILMIKSLKTCWPSALTRKALTMSICWQTFCKSIKNGSYN